LGHERAAVSGSSPYDTLGMAVEERRGSGQGLSSLAKRTGQFDDPRVRQLIGEAKTLTRVHGALAGRIGTSIQTGRLPAPAGSISRLSGGLLGVRLSSIALDIVGDHAVAWEEGDSMGEVGVAYLGRQGACLGGGSTEMARNLISERVLGMPREPSNDVDRPFREVRTNALR
jgi:alkylation response protein AidB-like acyl-CoA dehydrogenase